MVVNILKSCFSHSENSGVTENFVTNARSIHHTLPIPFRTLHGSTRQRNRNSLLSAKQHIIEYK